jgi:hypothetical protein
MDMDMAVVMFLHAAIIIVEQQTNNYEIIL